MPPTCQTTVFFQEKKRKEDDRRRKKQRRTEYIKSDHIAALKKTGSTLLGKGGLLWVQKYRVFWVFVTFFSLGLIVVFLVLQTSYFSVSNYISVSLTDFAFSILNLM